MLRTLPRLGYDPRLALIFWIVIALVGWQYRRVARLQKQLYGVALINPVRETIVTTLQGVVGGLVGSILLVVVGISATDLGAGYLLLVAVLLSMIHPRLMCFSYAGAILAFSHLLFGWPRLSVPAVVALVAILHIMESILIRFTGHQGAAAMPISTERGELVGGFALQRFWAMPIFLLLLIQLPSGVPAGAIPMPDWWPLIPALDLAGAGENGLFVLLPVAAALGYSDLALTQWPRQRTRQSAWQLGVYSVSLLLLAVASVFYPILHWAAAAASAFGHELVIKLGTRNQEGARPVLSQPAMGVLVLDTLPQSPARQAGLRSGDVIRAVDGEPVYSRDAVQSALAQPGRRELTLRDGQRITVSGAVDLAGELGLLLLPPAGGVYVQRRRGGLLQRWWRKWRRM
jgi:hypothetical protein